MNKTIRRNILSLLSFMGVLMIAGNLLAASAYVVLAIYLVVLYQKGKDDLILVTFIAILMLGDNRLAVLQFVKELRVLSILFLFIFTILEIRRKEIQLQKLFIHFIPFAGISLIAAVNSLDWSTALFKSFSFFLIYFVMFHYGRKVLQDMGEQLIHSFILVTNILLSLGLVLIFISPDIVFYAGTRYNGLLGNPNGIGVFVSLLLPLYTIYFRKYNSKHSKFFVVYTFSLAFISVFLCSSRNAMLSSSIFIIAYLLLSARLPVRIFIALVVIPSVFFVLFVLEIEGLASLLGAEKYLRISNIEDGSGRTHAWVFAMERIKEFPIIGRGFSYDEYLFREEMSYELWRTGHQGGVHNSFLMLILNTGYLGLSFLIYFFFNVARKIRRPKVLIPLLLMVCVNAMFESWAGASLNAFTILWLLGLNMLMPGSQVIESLPAPELDSTEMRKENENTLPVF